MYIIIWRYQFKGDQWKAYEKTFRTRNTALEYATSMSHDPDMKDRIFKVAYANEWIEL